MGDPFHAASMTDGGSVAFTGWNDQNLRCSSVMRNSPTGAASTIVFGQGAPSSTQHVRIWISRSLSLPVGGIFGLSLKRIACTIKLSSGLPGATAGPRSPPLRSDSLEVILRSPLVLLSP